MPNYIGKYFFRNIWFVYYLTQKDGITTPADLWMDLN